MCTCDEILDLLSARLDGVLTGEEERTLAEHLEGCPECRALAKELACIHTLLPGLNEEPPAFIKENVMARIREEAAAPIPFPVPRKTAHRWRAWGGVAAVLAVALLGAFALKGTFERGAYGGAMMAAGGAMPSAAAEAPVSPTESDDARFAPQMAGGGASPSESATVGEDRDAPVQSNEQSSQASSRLAEAPAPTPSPSAPPQKSADPESSASMAIAPSSGEAPLRSSFFSIKAEPSPARAGVKLYGELLEEEHPGAVWTEGEDFTGYLLPEGEWRLEYVGLSKDERNYLFHAYTDPAAGDWYAVPADGGEIRTCDPVPAE